MKREGFREDAMEKDKSSGMLTVDEILATKGFENFTKEQAEEYIQLMIQFCVIMYESYSSIEKAKEKITNKNKAA